ncbi:MAG: hypothetical protein GWN67_13190 [Phycisphaerae bacterium]|nr:hypothetical protein [Phycisphaerae bacterium]NIP53018.1 hypothetical protein [Phycisphaerae bacterium]NIS53677.1 hypothetical protein [Phycisphaerae bacterium]NIU11240.1 hypothetical protein [Phycisphaerae bacterium]NIU57297.1 hypothetical protein [Phycisphaerae bacterium]
MFRKSGWIWRNNAFNVTILNFAAMFFVNFVAETNTYAKSGIKVENQSAKFAFSSNDKGEYLFDTGVLRGKLRPDGKSLGLSSLIHVPSGVRLNGRYGIFSFYRIFTNNKRYGHAAWDWPSVSKLLPDGGVQVFWPGGKDHPFEITATYRLTEETTVDLETTVKAQKDLQQFEVFLASYFHESFPAPYVYANAKSQKKGKLGFMSAEKSFGNWQMFPRDKNVLQIILDGRWEKEPNPVKWVIMPYLAAPVCVRRNEGANLAMILMAPQEDCFAISTPYRGEGHYSLYLSLFGRDVKAGEKVRSRCRLVVLPKGVSKRTTVISDRQIIELYQEYIKQLDG